MTIKSNDNRFKAYERKHNRNLATIERQIQAIFDTTVQLCAALGIRAQNLNEAAKTAFFQRPDIAVELEKLYQQLNGQLYACIVNGIDLSWTLANNKNNELVRQVFGGQWGKLTEEQQSRYLNNNDEAQRAFINRRRDGLRLSDRVWNYTKQFKTEIETALQEDIRAGIPAEEMTKDLKDYLKYPNMRFHRVRGKDGELHMSKRQAAFHPGRGVYRSSYKNALRLAITEGNIAYHTADFNRWQQFDFVVGIEIRLSKNHPVPDICDNLKGRYPKDFKFTGWHPHCRCSVITVLKTQGEMKRDTQKILDGEKTDTNSDNRVSRPPVAFKNWVGKNLDRIKRAKSLPYFLRDNPKYYNYALKKLGVDTTAAALKTTPVKQAHTTFYDNYMQNVQSWTEKENYRFERKTKLKFVDGKERSVEIYTTRGGTTIIKPVRLPKDYHLDIKSVANKLESLPVELKAQTQQIWLCNFYNPADAYWQKTYKNFTRSYATGGNGTITFYKCPSYTHDFAVADLPRTLAHENGHNFDHIVGKQLYGGDISKTKEWQQAVTLDEKVSGMKSPTTYGENAPTEDFAESCSKLITDKKWFEKNFPNRFKILQRLLGI